MEVRSPGRTRAYVWFALSGGAFLLAFASPVAAAERERSDTKRGLAAEAVREALQHEVYGLTDERARLLREAAAQDPKLEAAKWHSGQVLDDQGRWVEHDDLGNSPGVAAKLADYERFRSKQPDTLEGHLAVAAWCAKRKLLAQERAHLMHVLDLAPDHVAAREKLGHIRREGSWVSREELAAEQARGVQLEHDLKTWRPVMQEILKDLRHRSADRQAAAQERLESIHDPAALAAMVEVAMSVPDPEAAVFVEALAQKTAPDASVALAQVAAFSPSQTVRQAAALKLGERKAEEYVPHLLAALYMPVQSRVTGSLLPNGRLAFRHTFVREGMDKQQVLQLDTQYVRRERLGGNAQETTARAALDAVTDTFRREQAAAQQNAMTRALNQRIMWVLSEATTQQYADPAGWWKWWNLLNEIEVGGSKDVALLQHTKTVELTDYVPPPRPQQTGDEEEEPDNGPAPYPRVTEGSRWTAANLALVGDCLAAGTKIWTINGPANIEEMKVGDLVLSRSQDTGELTYKPVLKTSTRARSQLVKLTIDGETIATSGGHLFWVSGEGWVRSRQLQPGMIIHGVSGPARVQAVEKGELAETYNVIVADFSSYFVGDSKVYSHDNTARQPTRAVVPGLRLE